MKKLKRKLGLSSIIAISIAGMLGGIFVLPGIAAAKTGSSVWLAFLLAAICILPAVLSKSELATAMPKSGGAYVYIERAFGPLFGTISGLGLWVSLLLKSAFCLVGFGAYLLVLTNTDYLPIEYLSLIFLILIMLLNILGVKKVGKVQLFVVILSILSLISLLILGFPEVKEEYINPFMKFGDEGLITTIAFVYVAYAGVTKIAAIAGEVKNPNRNLPLAMIFSLVLITIIYTTISYVLVGNVSLEILQNDYKPIYTLSSTFGSEWFSVIIAIVGVLTLISMANSGVLASSRFPFAMANDKLLPQSFTKVHNKYLTPINTIFLTCFIMALVILFLDVEKIAKLASAFKVSMFIAVNLCVIILRETSVQWYNPSYKSPFYPYIQLFGIISGIILLFYLGWMPLMVLLSIGLLGTILYFIYGKKSSRSGVLLNYGHLPALFSIFKNKNEGSTQEISSNEVEELEYSDQESSVIVNLLGNEYSPENLTEVATSLSEGKKIKVVNITEVPDQTSLDAFTTKTPKIKSIERQINYLGKIQNADINYESLVTHNISHSIQSMSNNPSLEWLVLEWNGRAYNGLLINNPLGWILSNINSNFALFKDNGIRYFSEIVLAIRPNSKDLKQLVKTTAQIAKFHKANFTLLHIVSEETDESEIKNLKESSEKHIIEYSDFAKVRIEPSANPFECVEELSSEYDLLVLGTPRKDTWKSMLFGTGKDLFATQANCSVLRLTIKSTN